MTIKIEDLHHQFLNDFEKKYFHDDAKRLINSRAADLQRGIVLTEETYTGIRRFGIFKPDVDKDTDVSLINKNRFRK